MITNAGLSTFDTYTRLAELLAAPSEDGVTHAWLAIGEHYRLSMLSRVDGGTGANLVHGHFPHTWEVGIPDHLSQPTGPSWHRAAFDGADEDGNPMVVYTNVPVEAIKELAGCAPIRTRRPDPEPMVEHDPVDHPSHYTGHPSGVECIEITEHMNFCRGNAVKYIWRAGDKGDELEDLRKAAWYLAREIARLEATS